MIVITGQDLTIDDVVQVARHGAKVTLGTEARVAITRARVYVENKLAQGKAIYGLTTGFGDFQKVFIFPEDAKTLQHNLIISHSCGMGEPMPQEVARAMLLPADKFRGKGQQRAQAGNGTADDCYAQQRSDALYPGERFFGSLR